MKFNLFSMALLVSFNSFAGTATQSFPVDAALIKSMIKNDRIGDCQVTIQESNGSDLKLSLVKSAVRVVGDDGQLKSMSQTSINTVIDIDLTKSFGTNVSALADATGALHLNTGSTIIFFDVYSRLAYRLIDYKGSSSMGVTECAEYIRQR